MSFWQARTKIRAADKYFSEYIRRRDNRCVYAIPGKCKNWSSWKELTCSHFIKRRYESVRYDPDNCDAACRSCHMFVETAEGAKWLEAFKRKQLGETKFTGLLLRKQQTTKRDDKLMALITKQLLADLLHSV